MTVVPLRRPVRPVSPVKPNRQPPLAPIPPAVFLEPVFRAIEELDGIEPDGDYDDAA